MSKRAADKPVDAHRDIKRIRLDLTEAKEAEKVAQNQTYVLERELSSHPVYLAEKAAKQDEERKEDLAELLPPFLYDILVVKGVRTYGTLVDVSLERDWPDHDHMHEIVLTFTMQFSNGVVFSYDIEVDMDYDGELEFDESINIPRTGLDSLPLLWKEALKLNNKHAPKALASIVFWTMRDGDVMYCGEVLFSSIRSELSQLKVPKRSTRLMKSTVISDEGSDSGSD